MVQSEGISTIQRTEARKKGMRKNSGILRSKRHASKLQGKNCSIPGRVTPKTQKKKKKKKNGTWCYLA